MPVKPRGGSFEATVVYKKRRFRRSFDNKPAADLWEADSRARLMRGEEPVLSANAAANDGKPRTLQQLYDHTYENRWAHQKSAVTSASNGKVVISILGGDTPVSQLDKQAANRLQSGLKARGAATATINRKLTALSTMLAEAEELGVIASKPRIRLLKEPEGRIRRFTVAEEELALAFFTQLGNQDMVDYITVSIDTGLRQEEVLRLDQQLTVDRRYVKVFDGKNYRNRAVPVTPRVAEIVERRQPKDNRATLFAGLDADRITQRWNRFRASLHLSDDPNFVPHIMRHEFCSRLADNGEGAAVIMALAGHATLTTSQRYIHMSPTALEAAITRLANRHLVDIKAPIQSVPPVARHAPEAATGVMMIDLDAWKQSGKSLEAFAFSQ